MPNSHAPVAVASVKVLVDQVGYAEPAPRLAPLIVHHTRPSISAASGHAVPDTLSVSPVLVLVPLKITIFRLFGVPEAYKLTGKSIVDHSV
jgi:hypothetical protein